MKNELIESLLIGIVFFGIMPILKKITIFVSINNY